MCVAHILHTNCICSMCCCLLSPQHIFRQICLLRCDSVRRSLSRITNVILFIVILSSKDTKNQLTSFCRFGLCVDHRIKTIQPHAPNKRHVHVERFVQLTFPVRFKLSSQSIVYRICAACVLFTVVSRAQTIPPTLTWYTNNIHKILI